MTNIYSEIYHVGDDDITVDVHQGTYTGDIHRGFEGDDDGSSLETVNYFNTLKGGRGKDTLSAQKSYATLDGGDGDDYIIIDADRADENVSNLVLIGGAGKDTLMTAALQSMKTMRVWRKQMPVYWRRRISIRCPTVLLTMPTVRLRICV